MTNKAGLTDNEEKEEQKSEVLDNQAVVKKSVTGSEAYEIDDEQSNFFDDEVVVTAPEGNSVLNAGTAKDEKFWDWVFDSENANPVRASGQTTGLEDSVLERLGENRKSRQHYSRTYVQNAQKRSMDKSEMSKCTSIEDYARKLIEA